MPLGGLYKPARSAIHSRIVCGDGRSAIRQRPNEGLFGACGARSAHCPSSTSWTAFGLSSRLTTRETGGVRDSLEFPPDGRKNHLRHRCAKDHAQLRAGFILARYRLRRAIEAAKNPQDLAEEVPAFGRQVSGLSLFIDKPAAELILQTPHSMADRRLGYIQHPRGPRETSHLGGLAMFHLLMLRRCLLRRRLTSIPGKAWSVSILSAELGWGSIRERLVYGELEAAHAPGPLLFSILLGTHSRACGVTTDLASRGLRDASNRNHRFQQAIRVLLPWLIPDKVRCSFLRPPVPLRQSSRVGSFRRSERVWLLPLHSLRRFSNGSAFSPR